MNDRYNQIIRILLSSKDYVTGDNLATTLGVSSRTIRTDIKNINSIIKNDGIEILSEKGSGYYLKTYDENKIEIYRKTMEANKKKDFLNIISTESENRVKYIISKLLLNLLSKDNEIIEDFALEEELFVSSSTLKKDFRMANKILGKYDLKISITKKHGVRVIENEIKIRDCISDYIFNDRESFANIDNQFYKNIFCEKEIYSLRKILIEEVSKYNLCLTDISFNNVLIHSLIMLKRFIKQETVLYEESDIKIFETKNEFKCAQGIANRIKDEFGMNIGNEVYYLTQHLISSQRFNISCLKENYDYKDEIQSILNKICERTKIDLFDDKQLSNGLSLHLNSALFRLRYGMNIRNEVLNSIKNMYPLSFELAVIAAEIIEQNYNLKTKESEIGFLAIHFGAALERKGLNRKTQRKKAIIVCFAGIASAMFIKEKIERHFGSELEIIKICPGHEVTHELIDSVDIVLTTMELCDFHSPKIKKINLVLTDKDINEIRQMLDGSNNKNKIDYRDIFLKELFFTNQPIKDKFQTLEYMTDIMLKKGYITKKVKESIFKREEMATTEIGNLVAIPHSLINDTHKAIVSVMILKKPILWQEEKVQVILLLNIPICQYDKWEIVFKKLYRYLIDENGVYNLIQNKDYEEFIQHIEN